MSSVLIFFSKIGKVQIRSNSQTKHVSIVNSWRICRKPNEWGANAERITSVHCNKWHRMHRVHPTYAKCVKNDNTKTNVGPNFPERRAGGPSLFSWALKFKFYLFFYVRSVQELFFKSIILKQVTNILNRTSRKWLDGLRVIFEHLLII